MSPDMPLPARLTTFAGGACAVRRPAFGAAGGLPGAFFDAYLLDWHRLKQAP